MRIICFILGCILILTACTSQHKSNPITLTGKDGQYDFSAIAEAIGARKIVALGESAHGIGDYYTFKSELIQYLHQHHGFEVIAFEAGFGDVNTAWSMIDSLSGQELLYQTLFGNFKCEEVSGLFDYIKTQSPSSNPLIYAGFDNQQSSSYFQNFIQPIISKYDVGLADSLDYKLNGYRRWFQSARTEQSDIWDTEAKVFVQTNKRIQQIFSNHKSEIIQSDGVTEVQFKLIDRTTESFMETVDLKYEDRMQAIGLRDAIMYDNFEWLMSELYPEKKVILWAHNAHIEQNKFHEYSFKWLGHFLNDQYGDDYYTIGLFAQQGAYYQQWGDTTIAFHHTDTTMIEQKIQLGNSKAVFQDISKSDNSESWIRDTINAFEPENMGVVSFIPYNRFDGIVLLKDVRAPSY